MDNISRRHSNEDTTTSMYLSFDAESTMSTACYKTMEAMSDISALSAIDINNSVEQKSGDNKMNSTLEVHENASALKTVKKIEIQNVKLNSPLRVLPKNILKEYKALCSTPAREQLLKTVDVTRGSDASRCVDLGLAFLGVEDEKPAYFPPYYMGLHEENKENALPDVEEVSSLSTCSSVEIITSVIEKKTSSMSTVGSITQEDAVEDMKCIKNVEKDNKFAIDMAHEVFEVNSMLNVKPSKTEEIANLMKFKKENFEITPKARLDDVKYVDTIKESLEIQNEKSSLVKKDEISVDMVDQVMEVNSILDGANNEFQNEEENANKMKFNTEKVEATAKSKIEDVKCGIMKDCLETQADKTCLVQEMEIDRNSINKKSSKTKIGVLKANGRRSVCEPNLQTNRPSRIVNSDNKRRSFLPTCKKSTLNMDAEIEIPLLMNRMLKITNTPMKTEEDDTLLKKNEIAKNSTPADKRRSIISSIKTRTSLLPSAPGNKRHFSFNQRMSVVVKTTLNSPARKIARKSSISSVTSLQRKSTIPQKNTSTDNSKVKKTEILTRKSMVPKLDININNQSNIKSLDSLQERSNKPTGTTAQRKSLYPVAECHEKVINSNANISHNKPVISYTCNVCKEKFHVKSLLDAHKRSHESDNRPPAFIKKPLAITQPARGTVLGNSNQCKFCDKKFALLKALHIHLLQNCSKIPPSEKRKLQYTDLNHVEKAQLPVFTHNNLQSSASSSVSSASDTPRYTLRQNITKSSSESLNENKDIRKTSILITNVNGSNATTYQTVGPKTKKITAHAGVYRTPSKSVPCHLCKLTFKSILDYTNHNLTTHGRYKAIADGTGKAV